MRSLMIYRVSSLLTKLQVLSTITTTFCRECLLNCSLIPRYFVDDGVNDRVLYSASLPNIFGIGRCHLFFLVSCVLAQLAKKNSSSKS
mmetsp:Transcript_26682/g.62369  ORF Transcript_26682/g.62369 Transcript_26682/m.62369 type:complete len:88 (+) Transcript_26682:281-544(+)